MKYARIELLVDDEGAEPPLLHRLLLELFRVLVPGMALPAEQSQVPLGLKASMPVSIVGRPAYPQPEVFDTVLEPALGTSRGAILMRASKSTETLRGSLRDGESS